MSPTPSPQPFPYQGSKRLLAGQIISLFPVSGIDALVEPFAGSAAISVSARHQGVPVGIRLSDTNAPLMGLWELIINRPEYLIEEYTRLWTEQQEDPRSYYLKMRDEFNATKRPEILLYLLCRCVKASVRYNQKTGAFNQSADHRRLGAKPSNIASRISKTSRLMCGAEVRVGGYEEPLTQATENALVYMDPPYQGTTDVPDHRYINGLEFDHFSDALREAVNNGVSFIVSYDVVREDNKYGRPLPESLGLFHRNIVVGTSSQATLLGRKEQTQESIYLYPALTDRLGGARSVEQLLDA